ncbi:hypothetical protein HC752_04185 [Vibrio sp. S9_S30]|uniref:hypothetical protein n=1 Tax=Vibrio sp. S9_S30 TaxID=2720226 RepID=UPI0016815A45|nr:hypothetical protein [Vibrio sp. S9_S30]MBD1556126.1 hypothetical protein [Vibrio sp. S9_S30]
MPQKYKDFLSQPTNQHIVDAMTTAIDSEYYLSRARELKQIQPVVENWIDKRNALLTQKIGDALELLESGQGSLIDFRPEPNIEQCADASRRTCSEQLPLFHTERVKVNTACKIDIIKTDCANWEEHSTPFYKTTSIIASHIALALWMDVNDHVPWSLTNNTSEELNSLWKEKNVLMAYSSYSMLDTLPQSFSSLHPSLDTVTVRDIEAFFLPKFSSIYNSSPYQNYQWLKESFGTEISALGSQEDALRELFLVTQNFEHGSTFTISYNNHLGEPVKLGVEGGLDIPKGLPVPFSYLRSKTPPKAMSGCHSATRIVHSLAKTLNIPSSIILARGYLPPTESPFFTGHSMLYFPTVDRWLSHGDYIYGARDYFRYIEDKLDITIPSSQYTQASELAVCQGHESVGGCITGRWTVNKTVEGFVKDPSNKKTCLSTIQYILPNENGEALYLFSDDEILTILSKLGFSSVESYTQACNSK